MWPSYVVRGTWYLGVGRSGHLARRKDKHPAPQPPPPAGEGEASAHEDLRRGWPRWNGERPWWALPPSRREVLDEVARQQLVDMLRGPLPFADAVRPVRVLHEVERLSE